MRTLILALFLLISPWCGAVDSFSWPVYASGFVDRQGISLSGEKFEPVVASVAIGAWVYEGIGLELELGAGVSDDEVATLELEPESQFSLGIRLESEPINGVAAYALISASNVSIASRFNTGAAAASNQRFSGFRGAFGLTFPLFQRWVLDAAFVHSAYDDDFSINGFRVGARYSINNVRPRKFRGWFK